jgi:hypothetical protein
MGHVLRIVPAAALVAVVVAGCGGSASPQRSAFHGVPPALAQQWEGQASAIAAAASAGNSCRALRLASSLRADVAQSEHKLPYRLRSPLRTGVDALADRITCKPVVKKPAPPKKPPKKGPKPKPKPPKRHGPHGDDRGHDK